MLSDLVSGSSGIHAYFKTTVIGNEMTVRQDVQTRAQALLREPGFLNQFNRPLMDVILLEIERSIIYKRSNFKK